ncbi:MAG: TSUP family transporter [Betaproteobacteria bacterium]|nr:TSUP family transporter [Betaproteobacteria bacterium]
MELVLIGLTALLAAGLTLFSGFGLGTILMPAFALFVPVPVAIAATAVVHFLNNLFKLGLLAKKADWRVAALFGLPAMLASVVGARLLGLFARVPPLASYRMGGATFGITVLNLTIGILVVCFALLELWPRFRRLAFSARWLPTGGLLSGFFGGLSGNQGALRAAFLVKAGLSKESFVATGVVVAIAVDASRLSVYGTQLFREPLSFLRGMAEPVAIAVVCAFTGSFVGRRMLGKVTIRAVRLAVVAAMLLIGTGLAMGVV